MTGEEVLEVEMVYSGRVVSLFKYLVSVKGRKVLREVVKHPGAVAIVPLKDDGRIILVRQYRLPAGKSLVELPAGTKRSNEDEEECARRELIEETGYRARFIRRFKSVYLAPGYSTEKITFFVATGLEKTEQNLDEDEEVDVFEVTLEEALKMLKNGGIEDAKTIIGIYELAGEMSGKCP